MGYEVFVDDNFHYMDESERYRLGEFATAEEAIAVSKNIVDEFLSTAYSPGMTAWELWQSYVDFGEDPFIRPDHPGDPASHFSAWDYARERCQALCAEKPGGLEGHQPGGPATEEG